MPSRAATVRATLARALTRQRTNFNNQSDVKGRPHFHQSDTRSIGCSNFNQSDIKHRPHSHQSDTRSFYKTSTALHINSPSDQSGIMSHNSFYSAATDQSVIMSHNSFLSNATDHERSGMNDVHYQQDDRSRRVTSRSLDEWQSIDKFQTASYDICDECLKSLRGTILNFKSKRGIDSGSGTGSIPTLTMSFGTTWPRLYNCRGGEQLRCRSSCSAEHMQTTDFRCCSHVVRVPYCTSENNALMLNVDQSESLYNIDLYTAMPNDPWVVNLDLRQPSALPTSTPPDCFRSSCL